MKISNQLVDDAILAEIGARLVQLRLSRNLTQAQLAEQAGVSKRTLERIEAGAASQLVNLVRVCRSLGLIEQLDALVPAPLASPITQLQAQRRRRQRASKSKSGTLATTPATGRAWQWRESA